MTHQRPTPPTAPAAEAAALRQTGASPLRVGDPGRVGPYVPMALLGSGGMGRVYLARAADDGPGLFAVKVIRPEYAEDVRFQRRFEREAAVHARLGPPYAPRLCGTGFEDELLWMATEYIPGLDLTEAVRGGGALPAASVWRLVADLGRALAALSAAGVVHRDLKPSNVLLSVQGAHLIDFGISKAADASALTGTGNRVGTPAYMSPEYLRTGHCDASSDVFSLAGTLVYAATGRAPFGDGTGVDVMHRVAFEEPDPQVTGAVAAADPELAALLAQCLAKEPGLRPTAGRLVALGAAQTGADGWPEPLLGEVLARQEAYETLYRIPVERAVRLLPAGRPAAASRTPAPGPVSRPAPAGVAALDPFDAADGAPGVAGHRPLSSSAPSGVAAPLASSGVDAVPAPSSAPSGVEPVPAAWPDASGGGGGSALSGDGDESALSSAGAESPFGGGGESPFGSGGGSPFGGGSGSPLSGAGSGSASSGAGAEPSFGAGGGSPFGGGAESPLSGGGGGSALSGAGAEPPFGAGGGSPLTGAGAESPLSGAGSGSALSGAGAEPPFGAGGESPLTGAGAESLDPHAPAGAPAVPADPSAPASSPEASGRVSSSALPASSSLPAASSVSVSSGLPASSRPSAPSGLPASSGPSAARQAAGPVSAQPPSPSVSDEAASGVLPASGSRRWTRRQRGMVVAAGVALCAVAAGGLVLLRPDGGTTAAPHGDVETASGAVPGRQPGNVALPGTSGVPDRASVAGSADGRADVDGSRDPAQPEASGSAVVGSSTPGGPVSTTTAGTGTGTGTGTSASPSADPTTPAAEPPASQPWNTDCTYYNGNGKTREGDSGKKVLQVQCMLTKRGYGVGSGGVNGAFGPETTSAVRAFQGDKGLSADGVVAHDTWVALRGSD
ncbi:protein kinase [Streptomyces sp. NPDC005811]|uniref:protein kinase domain-containing protein n=1 Tax=Streptomyces sp. NPDC005811 TaxID=3154565 RepID=UPI0033F12FA3